MVWLWMLFTEFEWLCWDFSETKRTTTTKGYWLSKTGYSKKKTSRELQRSWKWFSYLHFLCIHQCCCALLWAYADDVCVCVCVFFTFVKPKGKEPFRWWTSMRSQNPRIPSLERTKVVVVVVLTGGTGDINTAISYILKGYMRETGKVQNRLCLVHCFLRLRNLKQ